MKRIQVPQVAGVAQKDNIVYEAFRRLIAGANSAFDSVMASVVWLQPTPAPVIQTGSASISDQFESGTIGTVGGTQYTLPAVDGAAGTYLQTDGAATLSWADSVPTGVILPYGGAAAPTDWLLCNGTSYATTTYPALFAVIGYTFGGGGANFNVPDMRQKFPLGKAAAGTGSTLGGTGGAIDHTHTEAHTHTMAHTHSLSAHYHTHSHVHGIAHTHNVDPPDTTTTTPSAGHNGAAGLDFSVADGAHTHNVNIAPVTSGPSSNATSSSASPSSDTGAPSTDATGASSAANTGAESAANTGTANPPFLSLNFIIRAA